MAYITGYPICTTPSEVLTIGLMRPEKYERGLRTIVKLDDRVWLLVDDEGDADCWVEREPRFHDSTRYQEFSDHYDAFERKHLESTMVQSGELVKPLVGGAL